MELVSCTPPVIISDSNLESWTLIGQGGFGVIHRARHKEWGMDVAVKLLHAHSGDCSSLLKEANLMREGGSPFVLRVLGVYRGDVPGLPQASMGLVMEFMENGSLASLLEHRGGPPPWPLAFRLVHQIALGMNFLHCHRPPLLHLDLKPSNVLLDSSLNAQITDFGLSKRAHSVSRGAHEEAGGTITYMPPEALTSLSYSPTTASDVYSFGVLLWSIITGEQPYPNAISSLIRFRIPLGDRPDLSKVDQGQAEGLPELVGLMTRCWSPKSGERPSFHECLPVTERVFKLHKATLADAIHRVQTELCGRSSEQSVEKLHRQVVSLHLSSSPRTLSAGPQNHVKATPVIQTRPPPREKTSEQPVVNRMDKAGPQDHVKATPVIQTRPPPREKTSEQPVVIRMDKAGPQDHVKATPVIQTRPPPREKTSEQPVVNRMDKGSAPPQPMRAFSVEAHGPSANQIPAYIPSTNWNQQGMWGSPRFQPGNFLGPQLSPGGISIYSSHVQGVQIGNNNTMIITERPRRRNMTAPSAVSPSALQQSHPPSK